VAVPKFLLTLRNSDGDPHAFQEQRLERAIGVIYLPRTERQSHYFEARIADQFDAVIHFDETNALTPLEREPIWETGEPPETFPTGV
jgi:erythromycin esterase-like protein